MRSGIICFLLFTMQVSLAQVFTIETVSRNDGSYEFPLIQSSQRPAIAKKINTIIQTDLGANPNVKNPFDSVNNEDEFHFEAGAVNGRVLSLIFTGAHSGCGYHVTEHVYNFDSRTGAAIDVNQLFVAAGMPKLKKALFKSWKEKLSANVDAQFGGEEFKTCLAEAPATSELDIDHMLIRDQGISFWAGYCLDGTESRFDVSKGPHEFSLSQLLPMLSPYGYSLFVEKSSGPMQMLLRGTIDGKYAISVTLFPGQNGAVTGKIVYDRIGEPINLRGTIVGNQLVLHEVDASNAPISNIDVSWDGTKLTGVFINLKSKKQMPFLASKEVSK